MATFRQTLNRILVDLGHADDQVDTGASSLTDKYHLKVAQTMNDFLEEIEQAGQWRVLRTRDTATVSAGALSGSFGTANERARVFVESDPHNGRLIPLVFDVTDGNDQQLLHEMDLATLLRKDQQDDNDTYNNGPTHFAVSPTGSGLDIYLYPRQSADVSIEADLVIPQSRMSYSTTAELDTSIKVPASILFLACSWWLKEDRGEEFGTRTNEAKMRYENKLAEAIAIEHDVQGFNDLVPV